MTDIAHFPRPGQNYPYIYFLIDAFDFLFQYTDIYFLNVCLLGWQRQLLAQQALLCAESVIASVCDSYQPIIRIFKIHTL